MVASLRNQKPFCLNSSECPATIPIDSSPPQHLDVATQKPTCLHSFPTKARHASDPHISILHRTSPRSPRPRKSRITAREKHASQSVARGRRGDLLQYCPSDMRAVGKRRPNERRHCVFVCCARNTCM